ncbi:MAG: hypothetical protein AB7F88_08300 [Pyrinomonadaceae bacterium]
MSEEENNADNSGAATAPAADIPSDPPSLDEHTTEPNAAEPVTPTSPDAPVPGKWQMPKPKFQQTSGYLPKGYLENLNNDPGSSPEDAAGSEDTTKEHVAIVSPSPARSADAEIAAAAVEPQPEMADQLIPEEPSAENQSAQAQKHSGSSGFFKLALGVIAIVVFLLAFLFAVYYFFLSTPSGGFNF